MRTTDVAVVGAGPAGMAAAYTAADLGASVVLIDEQVSVGGHLRWTLTRQVGPPDMIDGKRGVEIASAAGQYVEHDNIDLRLSTTVWGIFEENVLGTARGDEAEQLQAKTIILATGSTDIAWPFAGWTLPGVMTARAARIMMHIYRVLPGHRIVVVGSGFHGDQLVEDIESAGARVVHRMAVPDGLEAGGNACVEWVRVDGQQLAADAVVLGLGILPDPELARHALAEIGYSELSGCHVPVRTHLLETTTAGLYVVGDAAGICTAAEAICEGQLAAHAAVDSGEVDDALSRLADLRAPERTEELELLRPVEMLA